VSSCLVTEYVAGARPLVEHLREGPADAVLAAVADLLAKMHAGGFANRDLKAHNILVRGGAAGTPAGACLVDLDGVRQRRRVSPRLRAKNLRRLQRSFLECPAAGPRAWEVFQRYYHRPVLP